MRAITRVVLVGFGNIGQGLLPLLFQHFQAEITIFEQAVTPEHEAIAQEFGARLIERRINISNYQDTLEPILNEKTVLLNFAVSVSSIDLIQLAQSKNARYLDSCIEPWEYACTEQGHLESNYDLRESIKRVQQSCDGRATAVVAHGANPGFISILMKKALLEMAQIHGLYAEPSTRKEWAVLAKKLDIQVIQISERDTQVAAQPRRPEDFVCTWSVDGFITECLQAAELGWGTHEMSKLPTGSTLHTSDFLSALTLATSGKNTLVKSWSPNYLDFTGYLLTHNESLSISEYLTLHENSKVVYSPTVFYAYHPCDSCIESLSIPNEEIKNKNILKDEIVSGIDELGIFLISGTHGSLWLGSNLSIGKARKTSKYNNATSLQVTSSVIAALKWMETHPHQGIIESEYLDWKFIYDIAAEYWSPIIMTRTNWSPSTPEGQLTFQNFLVKN